MNTITLSGMVLSASPIREYDRRIEILTRERGRISAFANGARRQGSALSACTIPFTFGEFSLGEGRDSYTVKSAVIEKFFGEIASDYEKTCYASYFAEVMRYFTRENMEANQEILLLYVTLLALQKGKLPYPLVRVVYEARMMLLAGQSMELFTCLRCQKTGARSVYFSAGGIVCAACAAKDDELKKSYPFTLSPDALHTLQYALTAPYQRLYSFLVSDAVLAELTDFMKSYLGRYLAYHFHSLDYLP